MNLFENILNKAKTWVSYLATGQAWSDLYDWANPEQQDPIQRFFDDPKQDMSKKQALMDNLKSWVPTDVMKSYVTEKYYKQPEFKQVLPTVDPTFKTSGQENAMLMWAKFIWNIPSNLYNFGAGTVNLANTAYNEGIPETASMLGKWIVKWIGEWAQKVATTYQNEWLLSAVNKTAGGLAKYAVENPLDVLSPSLVKPAVWATGKAIVKTAGNITPVVKTIIKKPVQVIKNKATDIFWKELRPVQDIAGNILQPYKWMVENLDDATNGLRRVVEETWTNTDTFEGLLWKIDESLTKYGKMKQESLSQISQTQKSVSAQKALENLENVYDGVSSKEMLATQSRIRQLAKKNMQEWLTPLEMDEVKVLHTKANNLFNEKWQTTGWFSSDDLRGIRKDLKNEIEDFAEANWVTNIREINKAYWEIADAKTLAQNQVDNLKAYKGRQIPATRIQKIADFIMEFPVVKQAFSDPARILASSLFKTLRWDKINPIEVQKRLPNFLKELKDAWMRSWDLKKIEMMIQNEMKLLPAPSGKPVSANVVNVKPIVMPKKLSTGISENAKIRDPRIKANDDYLELKSLEDALNIWDEVAKSKARTAFNKKIQQVKVEMDRALYEQVMSREMKKIMRENYDSIYPQGMQTVFNKLKGYTKNKWNYNDIEWESWTSVLKKQFSDYTNEYNEKMWTNYTVNEMWDIFDDRYRKTPVKEIKKPIVKPKK